MTNSMRLWRKKNAAQISAQIARRALIFREDGSVGRIQHHTALAIRGRANAGRADDARSPEPASMCMA